MTEDLDEHSPTRRFSSRADHYARYRPGYPEELLPLLAREAGFSPASAIADVGAGTGILSEILLRNGNTVFAIEPNDAMRGIAEQSLSKYPRFRSVSSTAEQIDLPASSVDGVMVAQAFHWFEGPRAVAEFRRILKPGGFVALIWNVRNTAASPFMADYERIIRTYGSDFARSGKEVVSTERLRELFGPELRQHSLPNYQQLDWPGLEGRLLSASYVPLPGHPGHEAMMADLHRAFDVHQQDGHVRLEYQTRVYLISPF
jgi:SAM-dependent methyltransferase